MRGNEAPLERSNARNEIRAMNKYKVLIEVIHTERTIRRYWLV